jgi:hypothetical protein
VSGKVSLGPVKAAWAGVDATADRECLAKACQLSLKAVISQGGEVG